MHGIELTFSMHDVDCCKAKATYTSAALHIHVTYYMLVGSGLAVEGLV